MEARLAESPQLKKLRVIEDRDLPINPFSIQIIPFVRKSNNEADFAVIKETGEIIEQYDFHTIECLSPDQVTYYKRVANGHAKVETPISPSEFNSHLASALAQVVYENKITGEEESLVAYNCGGNLYLIGDTNWKLAMQAILDSGYGIGAGGSRHMNGTTVPLTQIEKMAAEHFGFEYSLFANTGLTGMKAAVEAIMIGSVSAESVMSDQSNEVVNFVLDKLKHLQNDKTINLSRYLEPIIDKLESIEGGKDSVEVSPVQAFRADGNVHPSVLDPLASLRLQKRIPPIKGFKGLEDLESKLKNSKSPEKVIFSNTVGSSDGFLDEEYIRGLINLCIKYGAHLVLDDAHGGYMSANGKGVIDFVSALPADARDYITLFTTESKHKENEGGIIYTNSKILRDAALFTSGLIFTAAPGPSKLEFALEKLEWIMAAADESRDYREYVTRSIENLNGSDGDKAELIMNEIIPSITNKFEKGHALAERLTDHFERDQIPHFRTHEKTPVWNIGMNIPNHIDRKSDDYNVYAYMLWYIMLVVCRVYTNLFVPEGSGKAEAGLRLSIHTHMGKQAIDSIAKAVKRWKVISDLIFKYVEYNKDKELKDLVPELNFMLESIGTTTDRSLDAALDYASKNMSKPIFELIPEILLKLEKPELSAVES